MTNTKLLESKIKSTGIKKSKIAQEIKISRDWLRKKIYNKADFKAHEIQTISKLLTLTNAERDCIFFN